MALRAGGGFAKLKKLFEGGSMRSILVAALLLSTSNAIAVTIDFDEHIHNSGSDFANEDSIVTDDYVSDGIVFGKDGVSPGGVVSWNLNTNSDPKGLCALGFDGWTDCASDIYFYFVLANDANTLATTDYLSFYVGDSGTDLDSWIINTYDPFNNLLESRTVTSYRNILVEFSYSDIHRVEILWNRDTDTGYLLDDVSFNTTVAAIPIPAAIWLFGSALLGLGWLRRKQST